MDTSKNPGCLKCRHSTLKKRHTFFFGAQECMACDVHYSTEYSPLFGMVRKYQRCENLNREGQCEKFKPLGIFQRLMSRIGGL